MQKNPKNLTLRKSGTTGDSLIITIPKQIRRAFALSAGDLVSYVQEPDGVKLKFGYAAQAFGTPAQPHCDATGISDAR
jgi:bifunctional DNA-binding transcriptional regulator/antitoxin component of YhaV-PrlF toxin-antitoxin module